MILLACDSCGNEMCGKFIESRFIEPLGALACMCFANVRSTAVYFMFERFGKAYYARAEDVPEWRNGRRGGLKNLYGNMCGFKSHLGHQKRVAVKRLPPSFVYLSVGFEPTLTSLYRHGVR